MSTQPTVPPHALRPMDDFDPTEPAILHDRLNDQIVTWTGELKDDWVKKAKPHTIGVIEFDGLLFDGWGNVLGG
jgi:hypothetical protein